MTTLVNILIQIFFPALLLGFLGFALLNYRFAVARRLIGSMLVVLTILSMPVVPSYLIFWLESCAIDKPSVHKPQAIVILGAGTAISKEYGGYSVGTTTLLRVRYGAEIARQSNLPILLAGGNPDGTPHSEAWYMNKVLTEEFKQPVRWIEDKSNNTTEGARYSAAILKTDNIQTAYLVTNASHMLRARFAFEREGISVVPAPTIFIGSKPSAYWLAYIPSASGLAKMHEFLHELTGLAVHWAKDVKERTF